MGRSEKWHVPRMLQRCFEEAGTEQGWFEDSKPLILAVSGGSDSVALVVLAFFLLPRERLVLGHLEHGIRGEASLEDARFVRHLAAELKLPLECRHVITEEHRKAHESLESTARRLRYDFLKELSRKYGEAWIATGHTKNDVQETVLLNLFRGTGIRGLGGVPSRRGIVVRPLLNCSRQELRDFLEKNGFSWKEDATNEDTSYVRNYIRKILLPQIEENINSRAGEHLADLASDVRIIRKRDEKMYENLLVRLGREIPLALSSWDLALARSLSSWDLRMALMEQARGLGIPPLSRSRMIKLEKLLRTSGRWRFQWKGGVDLLCGAGLLSWILPEKHLPVESADICLEDFPSSRKSGSWIVTVEEVFSGSPGSVVLGNCEALLASGPSETLRLCSLEAWLKTGEPAQTDRFRKKLPWWIHPLWPVILWGTGKAWIPGTGGECPNFPETTSFSGENHVTIARLSCSPSENSLRKSGE